ncbi:MAG: 2-C-methyl-D-erythritol 2,4-cyclodiphosphate synthase [candidate division Zixibacteria bacterium RBG_16_48_11]|nr:MAG: 2-C-methyl-D-erythritol 2,4-cyclodiphosphate synthase [candidate division Zixibacteria bacterium RBG_16_48_11]
MLKIGIGYDVHPLVPGRDLILGGVKIPYEKGLSGHSDADIVCHAVADSLLGAMAHGDLGKHFPDSDPRFHNISSLLILEKVKSILTDKKGKVSNLDLTIIAEEPKLSPYTTQMRENLGRVLQVPAQAISIKCSSNNGLGFIGEGKGMACLAVSLVEVEV